MTDFPNSLPKGHRLHEYEIVRVLGVGGFGVTYLAFDHHLDTAVAIKEYLPNELAVRMDGLSVNPKSSSDRDDFQWGLDRFLDEARTLARFDHPSIIRVIRFFEGNDTAYIVMEYADGETLAAYLHDHGPLDEDELKAVLLPLLDGLEQVHQAELLHRDIKPDNIILRADGSPVLIDFGAARLAVTGRSRSLSAVLSPGYAPIEQYSTRGNQGPWTDIYALSAVAYTALTGHKPIEATERVRNDPLEPAVEAAAGRAGKTFLAGVDAGLAVFDDERPRALSAWRDSLSGLQEEGAEPASSPKSVKESGRSTPHPPGSGEASGSATTGNKNGPRYPRLMWPAMALALLIAIASIWAFRPAPVPDHELGRDDVVAEIQDYLNRLGYRVPEDGEVDARTTESIRDFEQAQGLVVTGTPDEVVLDSLFQEFNRRDDEAWAQARDTDTEEAYNEYVEDFPSGRYIEQVDERMAAARDREAWAAAQGADTEQAYRQYAESFPEGQFIAEVEGEITRVQAEAQRRRELAEAEEQRRREEAAAVEHRRELITNIQTELQRLGRDVAVDGVAGQGTTEQIHAFERATDRTESGEPSEPLLAALEATDRWPAPQPGETFRDCPDCPEMVVIPAGLFQMGSPPNEVDRENVEGPQHRVSVPTFALAKKEITVREFRNFVEATAYRTDAERNASGNAGCLVYDSGWKWISGFSWRNTGLDQREDHPVICVSWNDARAYLRWLSELTEEDYRLPSEAEHEYALRAGSTTPWPWGNNVGSSCAHGNVADRSAIQNFRNWAIVNCNDGYVHLSPVGSFRSNSFGLLDMSGNVWEWVLDCWNENYVGAPADGSPWLAGDCSRAVLRGGAWNSQGFLLRSAARIKSPRVDRDFYTGFRPARSLQGSTVDR